MFSKFKMLSVSAKNHFTISIFSIKPSLCPDFLNKSWKMVLKTLRAKVIWRWRIGLQANLKLWPTFGLIVRIHCTCMLLVSFKINLEPCRCKNTLRFRHMTLKAILSLQIGKSKDQLLKIISKKRKTGPISSHCLNYTELLRNSSPMMTAWRKTRG